MLGLEKEETPRKMLMRGRENPDRGANDMQMLGDRAIKIRRLQEKTLSLDNLTVSGFLLPPEDLL